MKRNYLLLPIILLFVFTSFTLQAAHILGGSITYIKVSPGQYLVTAEILRDCGGGGALFDQLAPFGVFTYQNGVYSEYENLEIPLQPEIENIDLIPSNSICAYPINLCVEKGKYIFDLELPENTGTYTIAYQRCCRSESITNLVDPGGMGMTFMTEINTDLDNNSPVFNKDIPLATFTNVSFVYDGSVTDVDGDQLVYELSTPLSGGGLAGSASLAGDPFACNGTAPNPICPPPYDSVPFIIPNFSQENMLGGDYPLTIDPDLGEMAATSTMIGIFQIGYTVKEFRDGNLIGSTRREFTFVTVPIDDGTLYNVGGTVYIDDSTTLDDGMVELFEHDIDGDSLIYLTEIPVNEEGQYHFPSIPPGVHYLRAAPAPSSAYFTDYLPTYYRNDLLWYDANPLSECDTSGFYRDIYLVPGQSPEGINDLGGTISAPGNEQSVVNLDVLLLDDTGKFLQHTTTNSAGYFVFEKLSEGTYQIYVDLVNSNIDNTNPPFINLSSSTNYDFTLYDNYLGLDGITNLEELSKLNQLHIFPNPTQDQLFIRGDLEGLVEVQIVNTFGKVLFRKSQFINQPIDLSNMSSGLYFVQIKYGEESVVEKLVVR